MISHLFRYRWVAVLVILAVPSLSAQAVAVTYEVLPAQSVLNVSGVLLNDTSTLEEQSPGSLSSRFAGMLNLNVSGQAITFDGSSRIDATLHSSAPFAPPGPGEDNFGGSAFVVFTTGVTAARDIEFTILPGTTAFGAPASGLEFDFTRGVLAYSVNNIFGPPSTGTEQLSESAPGTNQSSSPITRTDDGITETVTVPIDFTVSLSALNPDDCTLRFQGQIVATRTLAAVSADFDGDLDVDGADFLIWQRGLGQTGPTPAAQGNADGDLDVDGDDLAVWRDSFGPGAVNAALAVPEPSSGLLMAAGLLAALTCPAPSPRSRTVGGKRCH
jgi:hypothetical protein